VDGIERVLSEIFGFCGSGSRRLAVRPARRGTFSCVKMGATPGIFSAAAVSMFLILA